MRGKKLRSEKHLNEAFIEFTQSEHYKQIAKQNDSLGGKYRGYLSRFNNGKLRSGAIVELLLSNGYVITAMKDENFLKNQLIELENRISKIEQEKKGMTGRATNKSV